MVAFGLLVAVAITLVRDAPAFVRHGHRRLLLGPVVALGSRHQPEKGLTRTCRPFLYGDPLRRHRRPSFLWMGALFLVVAAYLAFLYNRILLLGSTRGCPAKESALRP